MSLYEILGVGPDADTDTIKRAYRKLAMEHHPDRGGDKARMQQVQQAYDVLSDPGRRERYDETGATTAEPTLEEKANSLLAQMMNEIVDRLDDLETDDPVQAARANLHGAITQNEHSIAQLERRIAKRETALSRLWSRKVGATHAADALRDVIGALRSEIAKVDGLQALLRKVLDLLAEYEYRADPKPAKLTTDSFFSTEDISRAFFRARMKP